MAKWMGILLMLVFISCGGKKNSLSGDAPVKATDFIKAFPDIKLPVTVFDTALARIGDTITISRAVLTQFIPDSAVQSLIGADKKITVKPVARIERDEEIYLLAKLLQNKKAE